MKLEFLHEPGEARRKATMNWLEMHQLIAKQGDSERYEETTAGKFAARLPLGLHESMMLHASIVDFNLNNDRVGCLIDIAAIAHVRDFRTSSATDLVAELIGNECQRVARCSENVANLCALEALFKQESDAEARLTLCEQYDIREDAVTEILQLRQEVAAELGITIRPMGTRNLKELLSESLLEASVGNWSDHIYHYVGTDAQGNAMYRKINQADAAVRYLDRYRVIGSPYLVIGKPLTLDLHPGQEPSRLIVQASVVPPRWFEQLPNLRELERQSAELQNAFAASPVAPEGVPAHGSRRSGSPR